MMVRKGLYFVAILLLASLAQGQKSKHTTAHKDGKDTTVAPISSTAHPTTAPPNTTVAPLPTTTVAPPTTTTIAPSTTTTVAPTTPSPPAPTPLPPPEKGMWAVYDKQNKSCIIVQMALQFNITYLTKDTKMAHALFDLPVNDTKLSNGSCGNLTQFMVLTWPNSVGNLSNNNMTFNFEKNTTSEKFLLTSVLINIDQDNKNFPNSASNKSIHLSHNEATFQTPLTMSYRCAKMQNMTLNSENLYNSTINLKDVQVQAFHNDKGTTFGSAMDCDYVDVPDIVPIAVGCALGGLVLIVLIAYLVGRRRNRARGYLSM